MAVMIIGSGIPAPASAAQSYDNCTGFIDALPATITTQGTWCLRHDLSTGISSGQAISVATNNVTIDCNDFKLGGLSAGSGTQTFGIAADGRLNITIRHCNIRGFIYGAVFSGSSGGGHLVEDNRFEGNTSAAIYLVGDGSMIRRNQISDTGGASSATGAAYGIYAISNVDILDNTISGVLPTANGSGDANAVGIFTSLNGSGSVSGNRVRDLVRLGTYEADGIYNINSGRLIMQGNHLVGDSSAGSIGLRCTNGTGSTRDNTISGFETAVSACASSGNMVVP